MFEYLLQDYKKMGKNICEIESLIYYKALKLDVSIASYRCEKVVTEN